MVYDEIHGFRRILSIIVTICLTKIPCTTRIPKLLCKEWQKRTTDFFVRGTCGLNGNERTFLNLGHWIILLNGYLELSLWEDSTLITTVTTTITNTNNTAAAACAAANTTTMLHNTITTARMASLLLPTTVAMVSLVIASVVAAAVAATTITTINATH